MKKQQSASICQSCSEEVSDSFIANTQGTFCDKFCFGKYQLSGNTGFPHDPAIRKCLGKIAKLETARDDWIARSELLEKQCDHWATAFCGLVKEILSAK